MAERRFYLLADYRLGLYKPDGRMCTGISDDFPPPQNQPLVHLSREVTVHAAYFEGDKGFIVIESSERHSAYDVARAIQAFLSTFGNLLPRAERSTYMLSELPRIPEPQWKSDELLSALREFDPEIGNTYPSELIAGTYVLGPLLAQLPRYVKVIFEDGHLSEAISHLNQSRVVFDGTMDASYYHYRFIRHREKLSDAVLEKSFLEERPRYEIAFVAAFKAIERILRVNDIKRHCLQRDMESCPYASVGFPLPYSRKFESFSGLPSDTTQGEAILRFLDLRNTVGAHANRRPPKALLITVDSLYEIQNFVSDIFMQTVDGLVQDGR